MAQCRTIKIDIDAKKLVKKLQRLKALCPSVKVCNLAAGDVVVFEYPQHLSDKTRLEMIQSIEELISESGSRAVILDGGARLAGILRGGGADDEVTG